MDDPSNDLTVVEWLKREIKSKYDEEFDAAFKKWTGYHYVVFETGQRLMADPETCLHNIIQSVLTDKGYPYTLCVSCDSTLGSEFLMKRTYEYDIDYNVWVYIPIKKE